MSADDEADVDRLLQDIKEGDYHAAKSAIDGLELRACKRRELDSATRTRIVRALLEVVTRPSPQGDHGVILFAELLKQHAVTSLGNYGREGRIAFPTILRFLRESYPFSFPKGGNQGAVHDFVAHLVLGDEEILSTIVRMAAEDEAKLER